MPRRHRTALLAASTLAGAAVLAACGSPVTAATTWRSASKLTTTTTASGAQVISVSGPLTSGTGKPVAGGSFKELCVQIGKTGAPAPAYSCLAVVNTGTNVYVAAGAVAGPYGKLASLATPATLGSLTLTNLSSDQTSGTPLVEISAAAGLNGNSRR